MPKTPPNCKIFTVLLNTQIQTNITIALLAGAVEYTDCFSAEG